VNRLLAAGSLVETDRRSISGYGLLVLIAALAGFVTGFLVGFLTYGAA
jgi:hypothetical protein